MTRLCFCIISSWNLYHVVAVCLHCVLLCIPPAFNTSSDYRLKENEVTISDGITRLKTLKPYTFNFKKDPDVKVDGFFAHEVSSVVPVAVTGTKDQVDEDNNPVYQGIDQSKLVPLLVAAVKELTARVETLEAA